MLKTQIKVKKSKKPKKYLNLTIHLPGLGKKEIIGGNKATKI